MEKAGIRPWETQLFQKHNVSAGRAGDARETPCSQFLSALEFPENSADADDGRGLRRWEGPEGWAGLQVLGFFFEPLMRLPPHTRQKFHSAGSILHGLPP